MSVVVSVSMVLDEPWVMNMVSGEGVVASSIGAVRWRGRVAVSGQRYENGSPVHACLFHVRCCILHLSAVPAAFHLMLEDAGSGSGFAWRGELFT